MTEYEAVIGIETHVELQTRSKMFCGCPVTFGAEPNTACCPVCLGLPGALPVPNEAAIDGILAIGSALDCELVEHSVFHRKNYFYPDLPKNYQISQYDLPLCVNGRIVIDVDGEPVTIGITRVHMEEDTGKSIHVGDGGRIADAGYSLLDFNRSGVPLVEIVTEPDVRSAEQARAYGAELQQIVRALGVSDARLEEGSMRFDANVSVRPRGSAVLGTRSEVKNVNSLRSLERAIAFEIDRQIGVLEAGGRVVQETRHWNEETGATSSMRSKEESEDYRYFQEPDLLPLHVDDAKRAAVRQALPVLPAARRAGYAETGIGGRLAAALVATDGLGELFEEAMASGAGARAAANWVTGEVVAHARRMGVGPADTPLTGQHLAELAAMVEDGELSATAAKDVLAGVLEGEGTPAEVAAGRDLIQISDASVIEDAVDAVLADNADAVGKITAGDTKPIGFLVGEVMKATGGKADPRLVSELIRSKAGG
ncbi:MAG TPA: Asp-tRNA(Asn)/Glu-tRNA(Gln) amidotransferase subunit GatB [Acidimicrobiia bacterium]|jgi:aspartyl-tRNA(Asn)/glutamyl-tRNA(Gln) amidotransferase subunit B